MANHDFIDEFARENWYRDPHTGMIKACAGKSPQLNYGSPGHHSSLDDRVAAGITGAAAPSSNKQLFSDAQKQNGVPQDSDLTREVERRRKDLTSQFERKYHLPDNPFTRSQPDRYGYSQPFRAGLREDESAVYDGKKPGVKKSLDDSSFYAIDFSHNSLMANVKKFDSTRFTSDNLEALEAALKLGRVLFERMLYLAVASDICKSDSASYGKYSSELERARTELTRAYSDVRGYLTSAIPKRVAEVLQQKPLHQSGGYALAAMQARP